MHYSSINEPICIKAKLLLRSDKVAGECFSARFCKTEARKNLQAHEYSVKMPKFYV